MPTLTPELIATLKQLSPDDKERVIDLLTEDDDLPPDSRTSEEWADEIARRAAMVASGNYTALTREEVEASVREAVAEARRK